MTTPENLSEIRATLQKFQNGYTAREVGRLDDFMQLFAPNYEIEMIGIGAAKRAATEWFEGRSRIREIVENDWLYWGDVRLDRERSKGVGHRTPFTFTAVLVKIESGWCFHTIHWAMPVD